MLCAPGVGLGIFVRQLTARFLLVLLLVSVFAPAAMALAAPASHACCMRKGMHEHGSSEPQLSSINCCERNCCGPLTVSFVADLRPGFKAQAASVSLAQKAEPHLSRSLLIDRSPQSERAPPSSSL